MKFYKHADGYFVIDNQIIPSGTCRLVFSDTTVKAVSIQTDKDVIENTPITSLEKENGTQYSSLSDLLTSIGDFFVNATQLLEVRVADLEENSGGGGGGGNPQIIDLLPGQYLSDVIQSITDASELKPYTINFYNHSKTVNWGTFTAKIHVPEYVNINFVGNINWWNKSYYPAMAFDDGLLANNPTDKLFLGFSFDRANDDYIIKVSGLPTNLQKIFFGGLDSAYQEAESYQNLLDAPEDWGEAEFGLVSVNGSKDDDVRNDALYKKIGNNFIDVTPSFQNVDFCGNYLQLSYFYAANCQSADFTAASCQSANFNSANCQSAYFGAANCQSASFYYANCQSASFYYANCQSAEFNSANCQSADFNAANCQSANFTAANCQSAYFNAANCQSANFNSANCQSAEFNAANWSNIVSIVGANFQNADLTGGTNLPDRINTKAKWIAECGAPNVNAQTLWIDGTSILS